MLRNSAILPLPCGIFSKGCRLNHTCNNDPAEPRQRSRSETSYRQLRRYADARSNGPFLGFDEECPWPKESSTAKLPTPYEILKLKKGSSYSKKRFYELVKIYHPDRHLHGKSSKDIHGVSQAVKLERYRLIIAANDILSDPIKRSAYDRCGAGWDGLAESYHWNSEKQRNTRWSGFEDNESVFRNATWEDWEKWHRQNNRARPEPLYLENRSFFTLVAFIAALAAVSQFSKAGQASQTFLDQVGVRHDTSSKNLHESRFGYRGAFPDKDQRIQKFLSCREHHNPDGTDQDATSSPTLVAASPICHAEGSS